MEEVQQIAARSTNSSLSLRRDEDVHQSDEQRPNETLLEYWTRRDSEAGQRKVRENNLQQRSKRIMSKTTYSHQQQQAQAGQPPVVGNSKQGFTLLDEILFPVDADAASSGSCNTSAEEEDGKQRSTATYSLPPEATNLYDFMFHDDDTTIDENLTPIIDDEDKEVPSWAKHAVQDAVRGALIIRKEDAQVTQFISSDDVSEIDFDTEEELSKPEFLDLHADLEYCSWSVLDQNLVYLSKYPDLILRTMLQVDYSHGNATPLHTACWKAPPPLALHMISLLPRFYQHMEKICLSLDADGNTALHLCAANICQDLQHNRMRLNGKNTHQNPDTSISAYYDEDEDAPHDQLEFESSPGFTGEDVIEALVLSAPRALTIQNNEGDTPLHLAVSSSFSTSLAVSILTDGASKACFLQDCTGACPLHAAIANNVDESVLDVLLKTAPDAARIADKQGLLPLHYVAAFSHTPIRFVRKIIDAHPDAIFAQTVDGDTPLHLAISNCKSEDELTISTVELLLGNHDVADSRNPVFIANNEKLIPLACCAVFDAPERVKEILVQHCIDHGPNDEASLLTFRQTAKLSLTLAPPAASSKAHIVDAVKNKMDDVAALMLNDNSSKPLIKGLESLNEDEILPEKEEKSIVQYGDSSGTSFYISGIADIQPPQTTLARIECLSKLFLVDSKGSSSLDKDKRRGRILNSQVNSLAKSLALPIFCSKG